MISKVVISAAGRGTRMKHLSKNKPKHMIQVNGKPFIFYLIENLRKAGLKEIIMVTGYQAEQIEEFARTHPYPITIINQFAVLGEEEYGTACPIKVVRDIVGKEQFLSVAGDNYYEVSDIKKMLQEDDYIYVGATHTDTPERYGVFVTEGDRLIEIREKPQEFVSDLINVSMYKFTPDVFDCVAGLDKSPRGEYEITDAITELARRGKVKVVSLEHYWTDFGNPADIPKLSKFFKKDT